MNKERYYITVVSKDHATKGVIGGFMQANHGKEAPLKRMKVNDWIIIYWNRRLIYNGNLPFYITKTTFLFL